MEDVSGVRCSLRITGPEFHYAFPEGIRIYCEYPPYESGEFVAHSRSKEAQGARQLALENLGVSFDAIDRVLRVLGLVDGD